MEYINFGEKKIDVNNEIELIKAYEEGYVLTRIDTGHMVKVRSIRVNLQRFYETSENKRIIKKFNHKIKLIRLPLQSFDPNILIMAKRFYDTNFGKDVFSGIKIKELLTKPNNFNVLLAYEYSSKFEGYCFCRIVETDEQKIIHYCYPFYLLEKIKTNFGIYMMTIAIKDFHDCGFNYFYLGSCHNSKCKYKLQFKGIEWFDETSNKWDDDLEKLKNIIK